MKERLKDLLAEYGRIAIGVYLVLFVLTFASFYIALRAGFSPDSSAGTAGTIGGAWLATKATQLLRIAATLGLTPLVAVVLRKKPRQSTESTPDESSPSVTPVSDSSSEADPRQD